MRTPSVGVGVANFAKIDSGTPADFRSPGVALDGTAAVITNQQINPVRLTASFSTTLESFALIPGLDAALRSELRATLGSKLDEAVLNGQAAVTDTSPAITGLLNSLTATPDPVPSQLWRLGTIYP